MSTAMTFAELKFGPWDAGHPEYGVQARHTFSNGYKVSVIKTKYSYGGFEGKYELAVLHPDVGIVYDTPVTSDVEGWLSEDDVSRLMGEVAALPQRKGGAA